MISLLATLSIDAPRAQSAALVAPTEIVLYTSPALKSRAFLPPLICALRRVLVAPVSTVEIDIAFSADMLATRSQLDVNKVFSHFMRSGASDGGRSTFRYLLLPYDLKVDTLNYVFATSYGDQTTPYHVGIVSTSRLDVSSPFFEHSDGAKITALRAYKLILKSVARVAGLTAPEGCILSFPRSLPELDQKSAEPRGPRNAGRRRHPEGGREGQRRLRRRFRTPAGRRDARVWPAVSVSAGRVSHP
jgi:predicted Zn-dependent protease